MQKLNPKLYAYYCIAASILNLFLAWFSHIGGRAQAIAIAITTITTIFAIFVAATRPLKVGSICYTDQMKALIINFSRLLTTLLAASVLIMSMKDIFDKPRMFIHLAVIMCFLCGIKVNENNNRRLTEESAATDSKE